MHIIAARIVMMCIVLLAHMAWTKILTRLTRQPKAASDMSVEIMAVCM